MLSTDVITVAVFDDNRLVRDALTGILGRLPDLKVVALDPADPAFVAGMTARVLLLDVGLPEQDRMQVVAALTRAHPGARIIVMDLLPMNEEIMEYVNAGVSGFVLKDATSGEFVATIRAVAGGARVLPPRMTASLFARIAREVATLGPARIVEDVRMTRREREITFLVGEGLSNKVLAQRLNIATHTMKSHVRNVMEKLTLHTRLQIAAYSRREGAA